jgi:hypothetical protein
MELLGLHHLTAISAMIRESIYHRGHTINADELAAASALLRR